jgi:hypothetical protein
MGRSKNHAPISLFSFQDLMISMIGVFIIVAMLLILLITEQVAEVIESASISIDQTTLDEIEQSKTEIKELEILVTTLSKIDVLDINKKNEFTKDELLDLDLDLVTVREELEAARREFDRIIIKSELEGDVGVGLALKQRRDALLEELDETRLRDKIVYLVSESDAQKPLILELSANQIIVSTTDQSENTTLHNNFDMAMAHAQSYLDAGGYYLLVVLKPSGMRLWKQVKHYISEKRKSGHQVDFGLDLISENHGTTNNFLISPTK